MKILLFIEEKDDLTENEIAFAINTTLLTLLVLPPNEITQRPLELGRLHFGFSGPWGSNPAAVIKD